VGCQKLMGSQGCPCLEIVLMCMDKLSVDSLQCSRHNSDLCRASTSPMMSLGSCWCMLAHLHNDVSVRSCCAKILSFIHLLILASSGWRGQGGEGGCRGRGL